MTVVGAPKYLELTTKDEAYEVTVLYWEKPVYSFILINDSSLYDVEVSFDGGDTWVKVEAEDVFSIEPLFDVGSTIIFIRCNGASQPVRIIYRLVEGG